MEWNWKIIPEEIPERGGIVIAIIEHWNTKKRIPAILRCVDEDDCYWRVVDAGVYESELSYDWNVVLWTDVPKFQEEEG